MDFQQNSGVGLIDIAMWSTALGIIFFGASFIKKQASNILLLIGSIVVIMTGVNIATYGNVDPPYAIDETTKFDFSRNKNIIVFLFDAYQMDLFLELAESKPDLVAPMEGFTAYENGAAVFAKTYPTIPLFLTGRRYQKKQPLLDFFKVAYDDSLMEKMQDKGWDVGLYPNIFHFPSLVNAIPISPKVMDNAIGGVPTNAKVETYLQSLDLSIFRAVPHILKPKIFNNGNFIVRNETMKNIYLYVIGDMNAHQPFQYKTKQRHKAVGFRDLMNEHAKLTTDDPAFRFYHFMIPHSPNWLDQDLNFVKHDPSFDAYRNYSIAGLKLLGAYLDSLKDIGAYDNATILVMSDHGMGTINKRQYNSKTKSYDEIDPYGHERSAAKSIFLLKKPGDRQKLSFSAKPVSGIDVAPTIAAAAGINIGKSEGQDVTTIEDDAVRTRLFNYYTFSTWDSKYLDDFEAFEIKGDVRDEASWTRLGMVKEKAKIKNRKSYRMGEVLSYGADIKNDSDFLNAFIKLDDYIVNPNYVNAPTGELDLNIKLKERPGAAETILLQFEIYSGETIDRKVIVNGHEQTLLIKPLRRRLNKGFLITPEMHKGKNTFNLSFRPTGPEGAKPLHLSSVKLSVVEP
ncbi:sulfatase-like hydrolase/transferase [Hellea sp.]|nr:sulfatase-like hydrolase/transferase [Hellea sp.]